MLGDFAKTKIHITTTPRLLRGLILKVVHTTHLRLDIKFVDE